MCESTLNACLESGDAQLYTFQNVNFGFQVKTNQVPDWLMEFLLLVKVFGETLVGGWSFRIVEVGKPKVLVGEWPLVGCNTGCRLELLPPSLRGVIPLRKEVLKPYWR